MEKTGARAALVILALILTVAVLWLGLAAMAPEPGKAGDGAALPVYVGGSGQENLNEPAFGPGPTVCSMDPRYRPNPGAEQTCPVVQ